MSGLLVAVGVVLLVAAFVALLVMFVGVMVALVWIALRSREFALSFVFGMMLAAIVGFILVGAGLAMRVAA